jgi:hypothetical protein
MNMTLFSLLTKTNLGRSFSHAVLVFCGAIFPLLVWTNSSTLRASAVAAIPTALTVLYRELAPNLPPSGGVVVVQPPTPVAAPPVTVSDPAPSA